MNPSIPAEQATTERPAIPASTRAAAVVVVAVAVAGGVWVTGALLTDDEAVAKVLTGLWLGFCGVVVVFVAWRRRALAVPLIATYALVAGGLGGFLLYTSNVDRVVDEDVVVAGQAVASPGSQQSDGGGDERANVVLASGQFADGAHPTTGTATLVDTATGGRVLTLTAFVTDPGPDLRVYLVPQGATGVDGGVDLGALKGNRGDQQYPVPEGGPSGTVVVWCRAFSVAFGQAALR